MLHGRAQVVYVFPRPRHEGGEKGILRSTMIQAGWLVTAPDEARVPADPSDMTPNALRLLADHLREIAQQLATHRGQIVGADDDERDRLESDVMWLEAHASLLSQVGNNNIEGFGRFGSQKRFKIEYLINVILFFLGSQQG